MEDSLGRNQLSILQIQELSTELQNVNDLPLSHAEKSLDSGCCPNWGEGGGAGAKSFLSNVAQKLCILYMFTVKPSPVTL